MTDFETGTGATRDDLLQRIELMESMIVQGRRDTGRYGWIFVAWGLCYITATLWASFGPHPGWAWPVCLVITILGVGAGQMRQFGGSRSQRAVTSKSNTLGSLWMVFGIAMMLFCGAAAASHHIGGVMFISVLCFFLGTVNVTSAAIYRWKVQAFAGAIWWAAGVVALFVGVNGAGIAFLVATFFSQIVFGFYLMFQERRRELHHA